MPDIFEALNSSIYVDDIFYGADSMEQTFKLSTEAHNVLEEVGMNYDSLVQIQQSFVNSGIIVG